MFRFRDKTVYIISPERWGTMKVSKHHYALELAERNCQVFFIEPPDLSFKGITVTPCTDHPLINIVKYRPVFRGKRFLPGAVFRFLLKQQIKRLISKISHRPDVVWCFHGYLFENLKWFGATINIYFAADQFFYDEIPPEIGSSDIILAVSDTIYERIKKSHKKVVQINHGLQKRFVKGAENLLANEIAFKPKMQLVAGYTGNLRMQALDRTTMRKVIEDNPEIKFLFWGSYKKNDLNLGGLQDMEADEFINFLESCPQVELRGMVSSEQLQLEMKEADLFWLCWKLGVNSIWDGSNSHKILEYLSTGKPVVSHYVSSYKDDNVLYMLKDKSNFEYCQLFRQTIDLVKNGENTEIVRQRLQKSIENSYSKNLEKIEELIKDA